jgi:hypothetical protein
VAVIIQDSNPRKYEILILTPSGYQVVFAPQSLIWYSIKALLLNKNLGEKSGCCHKKSKSESIVDKRISIVLQIDMTFCDNRMKSIPVAYY